MLKGQMVWSGWRAVGIERIYKNNTCEPRRGLGKNKGKADISDCLIRKARPLGMTWNSFLQQEWAHCRGKVHFLHLDSIRAMHEFLTSSCVYIQTTCIQEKRLLSCHCVFFLSAAFISPLYWIFLGLKGLTLQAPWLKGNDDRKCQCFIICVTLEPLPSLFETPEVCLHVSQRCCPVDLGWKAVQERSQCWEAS